jgi:hypothetical protein
MQRVTQEQIAEIIESIACPKNFSCYTSGFKNLCKAQDIGLESFLACMVPESLACKFSLLFGGISFCQCPLRIYIAKKLKK